MYFSNKFGGRSFLSASIMAAIFSTGAYAQSTLEEIVVTAQKREQSLQDVPISVQVVSGEKILEQGFNDLEEIATFTPGVIIEQGAVNDATIRIRGIANEGPNIAFEQAAVVFNDGLYYGRPMQSIAGVYDINQVEVLFGPQPVYFGQSATAGLISYSSARPTDDLDGYVVVEAGTDAFAKFEGAVSGALSDNWAYRLAGKYTETDGWTKNYNGGDANASSDSAFRLSLSGDLTDELSVWVKYEEFEQESDGTNSDSVICVAGGPAICPFGEANLGLVYDYNYTIAFGSSEDASVLGGAPEGNLDLTTLDAIQLDRMGISVDGSAGAVEVKYDISDEITFTSLTGFSDYESLAIQDFDRTPYASLAFPNSERYDQFSQELRIQSDSDSGLNWMAGLYWQDHELGFSNDIISALPNPMGPSGTNATEYEEEAEYFGAFATVTWDINDIFTLEYGIRYSDVSKSAYLWEVDSFLTDIDGNRVSNFAGGVAGSGTDVANGTQVYGYSGLVSEMVAGDRCLGDTPNGDDCEAALLASGVSQDLIDAWGDTDLELEDDDISHQLALNAVFDDQLSGFVRYVEGFKAGGFSRGSSSFIVDTKGVYDAEEVESIEVGGRYNWNEGRGRFNLTLYTTDYSNRQVTSAYDDPVTGVRNFIFINAASSTIQGFESGLTYAFDSGLTANLGLAYTDSEYDEFDNAECFAAETEANGYCTAGGTTDLSGTSFDGQPDWTANIGLGYSFNVADDLELRLNADAVIYDDWDNTRPSQADADIAALYSYREQDGFTVVNVRAALSPLDGQWELALYGRNITDELYWLSQPGDLGPFGTAEANISRPASAGVTFRYNLGN